MKNPLIVHAFASLVLPLMAGLYCIHSTALAAGVVVAWGENRFGQTNVPVDLTNVVAIAAGEARSLALRSDGTVVGWGMPADPRMAVVPTNLTGVIAIAAGGEHNLALLESGAVVAWGRNGYRQTNVPSAALSGIVAVSAGGTHSLALKANGTIVAWGDNGAAQGKVPRGLSNVVAVSAGDYHSLALRGDGTVIAWGDGNFGTTNVPPDLRDVIAIAAGYEHSLALQRDGRVVAWGWNAGGQTNVPGDLPKARAVATGYGFSLAISDSGTPLGWGSKGLPLGGTNNWQGELVQPGLSNVRALVGGTDHILALIDDAPAGTSLTQPDYLADGPQFETVVPTQRGTQYFLEWTDSLGPSAWLMGTPVTGDGGEHFLIDLKATERQRFYRVRCQ